MNIFYFRHSALKVVLCLFFLGFIPKLYAQTTYKVTYYISEPKLHGSIDNLDEKGKRMTKQVFARAKDLNYILIADQEQSYFELEDILRKENDSPLEGILSKMAARFASFNEKIYANNKGGNIIFVKRLVSQDFIVKRDHYDFNWVIKEDTKKILGYNAKKAVGNYYDYIKNRELKVEAWFIPSIPLQSGPDIFMGLPGLIAEVDLKSAVVTVKKIEPSQKLDINKIDDSKAMTQEEYEDLIKSLTEKYIDN